LGVFSQASRLDAGTYHLYIFIAGIKRCKNQLNIAVDYTTVKLAQLGLRCDNIVFAFEGI
jgi:hypothetical protein